VRARASRPRKLRESAGQTAEEAIPRRGARRDLGPRSAEAFEFEEEVDLITGEVYELPCEESEILAAARPGIVP
jgi:hypothetical protein